MRFIALTCLTIVWTASGLQSPSVSGRALYDPNPEHVWNRVHAALQVRTAASGEQFGFDTLDPLLWRETKHLLTGPSHTRALDLLDEFLHANGERLILDPVKRAVFQRDLWAVFDWAMSRHDDAQEARMALAQRLVRVMRRVALARKEIEALPDTYDLAAASGGFGDWSHGAQPQGVLPRDLFDASGPWVALGGLEPLTPLHTAELTRSSFIVLWRLPGGAAETAAYLRKLWSHPQPFVQDPIFRFEQQGEIRATINPSLPPLPVGVRLALVRRMLLVDAAGVIVPTPLVESVQLRLMPDAEGFAELRLNRAALFAGKGGGLRAVGRDEQDFITFSSKGFDLLERQTSAERLPGNVVIKGCTSCHHTPVDPPLATILSLPHMLKPTAFVDSKHDRWARWFTPAVIAVEAKARAYDWGVFTALWRTLPR